MAEAETDLRSWRVTGMDCGACAAKVRGAVEGLPGVSEVDVALMAERLRLRLDAESGSDARVEKAVRAIGFGIAPEGAPPETPKGGFVLPEGAFPAPAETADDAAPAGTAPHRDPRWHETAKGRFLIGTGALLVLATAVQLTVGGAAAHWAFVLATLIGVAPVARTAFRMARARMPFTIEMLMTIAALGALLIGAAGEAALVVFLFAVGETLEGLAAGKAREGIRALADLVPQTARVVVGQRIREVPAARLSVGQVVQVRPGDRIPADGEVIEGASGVDESPVTGESVPRARGPGDAVLAGSVNTDAELRIRVSRRSDDNTIARIVRLVQEAESARAPTERFIDRFSRVYMPAVVGIAALVAVLPPLVAGAMWETWIYRGLALLLIGCPCALVISVPASIASALATGARHGLLMKGGAVIEAAARTTRVAFDKTGTLTEGRPVVTDVLPFHDDAASLLARAAAVEGGSSHPLARAILDRAEHDGLGLPTAREASAIPGKCATAEVAGARLTVGSPRLAQEAGCLHAEARDRADSLEAEGKTVVAVFAADRIEGLIALRDAPRADAAEALARLRDMRIGSVMLTGDTRRAAEAIAGDLDVEARSELLPADKLAAIREMTASHRVMMVGDGINDAPALAAAHVGVAMGSGTDVALETADAAILGNRVADVPAQIRLARAAMANIRQNVAIALGLKGLFLVTTILGITGLWIAILADTGATVLVTLNALRLLGAVPGSGRLPALPVLRGHMPRRRAA